MSQEAACAVCLDELKNTCCVLNCGHQFHSACIWQWVLGQPHEQRNCPVCRVRVQGCDHSTQGFQLQEFFNSEDEHCPSEFPFPTCWDRALLFGMIRSLHRQLEIAKTRQQVTDDRVFSLSVLNMDQSVLLRSLGQLSAGMNFPTLAAGSFGVAGTTRSRTSRENPGIVRRRSNDESKADVPVSQERSIGRVVPEEPGERGGTQRRRRTRVSMDSQTTHPRRVRPRIGLGVREFAVSSSEDESELMYGLSGEIDRFSFTIRTISNIRNSSTDRH